MTAFRDELDGLLVSSIPAGLYSL